MGGDGAIPPVHEQNGGFFEFSQGKIQQPVLKII